MYTTIETRWFVGSNKLNSELKNPKLIEKLVSQGFEELENLNPMEGYTDPEDNLNSLNSLKQLQSRTQVTKKKKNKRNLVVKKERKSSTQNPTEFKWW